MAELLWTVSFCANSIGPFCSQSQSECRALKGSGDGARHQRDESSFLMRSLLPPLWPFPQDISQLSSRRFRDRCENGRGLRDRCEGGRRLLHPHEMRIRPYCSVSSRSAQSGDSKSILKLCAGVSFCAIFLFFPHILLTPEYFPLRFRSLNRLPGSPA